MKQYCWYYIELGAILLIIFISSCFLRFEHAVDYVIGMVAAYSIPRIIYTRLSHCAPVGRAALIFAWLTLALLSASQLSRTLPLPGEIEPNLWTDALRLHDFAKALYFGYGEIPTLEPFPGLPYMMILSWKLFGYSIIPPTAINIMCTLCSVVVSGSLAKTLLSGRTKQTDAWVSSLAMAMTVSLTYFLTLSVQLLKEPMIHLGVSLCGLAVAKLMRAQSKAINGKALLTFAAGIILVTSTRTTYAPIIAFGVVLLVIFFRKVWRNAAIMLALTSVIYIFFNSFFSIISVNIYDTLLDSDHSANMAFQFIIGPTQMSYGALIGDYFTYPWWKKAVLLPLTSAVQFIVPFPWLPSAESVSLHSIIVRQSWTWYIIGGLALYYIIWLSWRRNHNLAFWPIWVVFTFAVPAYVTAGSVSRYIIPFQPLFIPMAIYSIALYRQQQMRRPFIIYSCIYSTVIIITLAICYQVQSAFGA